jgi:redox-sensitive bicupin YhaK (pirin superfamily)
MAIILNSSDRGFRDLGWLKSYHTFSFGDYYNPHFTGYKNLRVINEDYLSPESGFPTHDHANMEIITYMLSGSLTHGDNLGHKKTIHAHEIQYLRAGHGISHSEHNESATDVTHFLQIWLLPKKRDMEPTYAHVNMQGNLANNKLTLIAAGFTDGNQTQDEKVIQLNADAKIYACLLQSNHELTHTPETTQDVWIQVISGKLIINGHGVARGGAIAFDSEQQISIHASEDAHFLLFDLCT